MTILIQGKKVATYGCSEFPQDHNFPIKEIDLIIVSLHCSISESIILRASPLLFTRGPCTDKDSLAHEVTSCSNISSLRINKPNKGALEIHTPLEIPSSDPFLPKIEQGITTRHSARITLYDEEKRLHTHRGLCSFLVCF